MSVVLVAAILFRILIMLISQYAISFDEAHYLRMAGQFKSAGISGLLHPYWSPFYPFTVSVFSFLFGDLVLTARIVNILMGTLVILLIARFTASFFGQREALVSAVFMAFFPALAFQATSAMPETLYTVMGIAGILTAWKALDRNSWLMGLVSGMLWAGNYLIKPEGAGYLLVFMAVGVLWILIDRTSKRWKRIPVMLILLVGFLAMAGPYLVYLHSSTGKWTLSTKGEVNQQLSAAVLFDNEGIKDPFYHLTDDNQYLPYDMAYHIGNLDDLHRIQGGNERIVHIPVKNYIKKYVRNVYKMLRFAIPRLFTAPLLVLWAIGFFGPVYQRKQWAKTGYLAAFVLFFWFMVIPLFHINDRYLAPMFPLMFIWIGNGCLILYRWLRENAKNFMPEQCPFRSCPNRAAMVILIAGLIFFSFLPELAKVVAVDRNSSDMWAQPVELKKAGLWLKARTDEPPVIMSINKAVDFYAGQYDMRKGASFSYDSIQRNLAYAIHRQVEYMVFSERYISWFPNLKPLIDNRDLPDNMRPIYRDTDASGLRTVIYRIVSPSSTNTGASKK